MKSRKSEWVTHFNCTHQGFYGGMLVKLIYLFKEKKWHDFSEILSRKIIYLEEIWTQQSLSPIISSSFSVGRVETDSLTWLFLFLCIRIALIEEIWVESKSVHLSPFSDYGGAHAPADVSCWQGSMFAANLCILLLAMCL